MSKTSGIKKKKKLSQCFKWFLFFFFQLEKHSSEFTTKCPLIRTRFSPMPFTAFPQIQNTHLTISCWGLWDLGRFAPPQHAATQLLRTHSTSAAQIRSTAWPAKEIVPRCAKHLLPAFAAVGEIKSPRSCCQGKKNLKSPWGGKRKTQEERGSGAGGAGPPLGPDPCSKISQARHRHRVWPSLVIPPCAPMHPHTCMIFTSWGLSLPFWAFGVGPCEGLLKAALLTLLPSD